MGPTSPRLRFDDRDPIGTYADHISVFLVQCMPVEDDIACPNLPEVWKVKGGAQFWPWEPCEWMQIQVVNSA